MAVAAIAMSIIVSNEQRLFRNLTEFSKENAMTTNTKHSGDRANGEKEEVGGRGRVAKRLILKYMSCVCVRLCASVCLSE